MNQCKHKYIHLDTRTHKENRTFGMPVWRRIDTYFCEKCLDEQRKEKYECHWDKPEWY